MGEVSGSHLKRLWGTVRPRRRSPRGGVLSEQEVRHFEQQYGVVLPKTYRNFLKTVGNGGPGPYYGIMSLEESYSAGMERERPGYLATPFPHTHAMGPDGFDDDEDEDWEEETPGSMIISSMGCASFVRLIVTGEARGQVWFDHLLVTGELEPGPDFADWYKAWQASPVWRTRTPRGRRA